MNFYKHYIGDWRCHPPGRWGSYDLLRSKLPRFSGVYAVYFGDDLIYVGSSTDIANRFCEHKVRLGYAKNIHTPWGTVADTTQITLKVRRSVRLGDWAMWEIRLINRLRPEFNQHHKRKKAA